MQKQEGNSDFVLVKKHNRIFVRHVLNYLNSFSLSLNQNKTDSSACMGSLVSSQEHIVNVLVILNFFKHRNILQVNYIYI